jgi:hypothetical protein
MAFCRKCLSNGMRRDGGDLGVCAQHRKGKCLICRAPSLGHEMCAAHEHEVELRRWAARANLKVMDPAGAHIDFELRDSLLQEAKFHAHESVEVFFRALHLAIQAIWGRPEVSQDDDQRKAA